MMDPPVPMPSGDDLATAKAGPSVHVTSAQVTGWKILCVYG